MRFFAANRSSFVLLAALGLVAGLSAFTEEEGAAKSDRSGQGVPASSFTNFESAHVHPIDMTPDGTKLLAVNTANNSLEVFTLSGTGMLHSASIPVGLDPVTVRARTNNEAWVVNTISDEVSIVDLTLKATIRSLTTENEPADVVFAGSPQRAFVSCAERESIQVFDPANLGTAPTEVLLKGEQPRALAVSPDGNTVYCAFFESGNRTTVIPGNAFHAAGFCSVQTGACTTINNVVANAAGPYGGVVPVPNSGAGFDPPMNPNNPPPPGNNSLVVRKNNAGQWMDANGGNWTNLVSGGLPNTLRQAGWDMPDRDVAIINANSPSTASVTYKQTLGNILMAMSVHPLGEVFVVGTDATNEVRFEPNLRGKFLRVNVSHFAGAGAVTINDLNPHINYATHTSAPALRQQSVGDPRGIAWRADGSKAYVTGMGSNNLITINVGGARTAAQPIPVGEGPTGVVIDEARGRAYVINKFGASVSTIDMSTDKEVARTGFFDPTPQVIKTGRKHLYNTHLGSGHGHISCGSCHVDGKWDRLAWDLGNPAGEMVTVNDPAGNKTFHPMKGLKTTQSLIDIISKGAGKLHWRGDKGSFHDFAGAFRDLQGTDAPLDVVGMQEFSDLLNACWYVPNPYRTIRPDSSVAASVERMNPNRVRFTGTTFQTVPSASVRLFVAVNVNCSHCHQTGSGRGHLPGNGSNVSAGQVNMTNNTNMVPDLRSVYRKNGFFYNTTECTSGFGLMSDGVMETRFNNPGVSGHYFGDYEPELLSWSGGITPVNSPASHQFDLVHPVQDALPAVGIRMTVNGSVGSVSRVASMKQYMADKYPADYAMVVKGIWNGEQRGFYYLGGDSYQPDQNGAAAVTHAQLIAHAQAGNPLTWTIVHPNTKVRHGVDRDMDGTYDYQDGDAELELSLYLDGPLNGTAMRSDLHSADLLPSSDPYGMGASAKPEVFTRTGAAAPVDWVMVQLRDNSSPTTVVDEMAAIVQANGRVVMANGESPLFFADAPRGSYRVVAWHRNHLAAMTLNGTTLGNGVAAMNFGDPALAMYGTDPRRILGSIAALWSGDVDGNGVLRYTGASNDRDPILQAIGGAVPTSSVTGYLDTDVNLDGVVRYVGTSNDRDPILVNIGGTIPTATRTEQLP